MAIQTTTFKGARYLVKFHDPIEWADTESYEAIEAVQYNAYTYISKQPVPVGVQIDNEEFWLLWADPNAQMEQLRQLVSQYVENVETLSGTVGNLSNALPISDFSAESTVKDNINAEIEARKLDIEKAHVFETVADMKQNDNLSVGAICHTNGFHTSGDNGAAWYEITDTGTANEMDVIACGELFANLIIMNDSVTPEMFGAYGNGVNDDTTYIQEALNYKIPIVFSDKTYNVSSNLSAFNNIIGNNTVLNNTSLDSLGIYYYETDKFIIDGIYIKAYGTERDLEGGTNKSGLYIQNCNNFKINFVEISGIQSLAIMIDNCSNYSVSNCYIHDCYADAIHNLRSSHNGSIFNNFIRDCGDDGIACVGYRSHQKVHDISIYGNHIIQTGQARAISTVAYVYNIEITNNDIIVAENGTAFATDGATATIIIDLDNLPIVENIIFSNNNILDNGTNGSGLHTLIRLDFCNKVCVSNNTIASTVVNENLTRIIHTSTSTWTVDGNTIHNHATNVSVENNIIQTKSNKPAVAVSIAGTANSKANINNFKVCNNTFVETGSLNFYNMTNVLISGNMFNNSVGNWSRIIQLEGVDYAQVTNNIATPTPSVYAYIVSGSTNCYVPTDGNSNINVTFQS